MPSKKSRSDKKIRNIHSSHLLFIQIISYTLRRLIDSHVPLNSQIFRKEYLNRKTPSIFKNISVQMRTI